MFIFCKLNLYFVIALFSIEIVDVAIMLIKQYLLSIDC